MTNKRLEALAGGVVRLVPKDGISWSPQGVLMGWDADTFHVQIRPGKVLNEPRGDFTGVEPVDADPTPYLRK